MLVANVISILATNVIPIEPLTGNRLMSNEKVLSIESEFEKLKKSVIPDNASAEQTEDMRIAFFAGASVMFAISIEVAQSDSPAEESFATIRNVGNELAQFAQDQISTSFSA